MGSVIDQAFIRNVAWMTIRNIAWMGLAPTGWPGRQSLTASLEWTRPTCPLHSLVKGAPPPGLVEG